MDFYPNRIPWQQGQILPSITLRTFEITLDIDKMKQIYESIKQVQVLVGGGGVFKITFQWKRIKLCRCPAFCFSESNVRKNDLAMKM